jgi:hypothetical protein
MHSYILKWRSYAPPNLSVKQYFVTLIQLLWEVAFSKPSIKSGDLERRLNVAGRGETVRDLKAGDDE